MGFFDGLLDVLKGGASSALTGLIGDYFGDNNATDQFNRNQQLMTQQSAINENMYRHRYYWTAQDMMNAGLNPILAATGGFSVGSGPSVSLPSQAMAPMPSVPSVASSAREVQELGQIEANIEKTKAEKLKIIEETVRTTEEARKLVEEAAKLRLEQGLVTAQERKTIAEVERAFAEVRELASRTAKQWVEVDATQAKTKLMKEETLNVQADRRVIEANERLLGKRVQELTYLLSELETTSNVYEGPVGQALTYMREIVRSLGLLPAIGAGARALFGKGGGITINQAPRNVGRFGGLYE